MPFCLSNTVCPRDITFHGYFIHGISFLCYLCRSVEFTRRRCIQQLNSNVYVHIHDAHFFITKLFYRIRKFLRESYRYWSSIEIVFSLAINCAAFETVPVQKATCKPLHSTPRSSKFKVQVLQPRQKWHVCESSRSEWFNFKDGSFIL